MGAESAWLDFLSHAAALVLCGCVCITVLFRIMSELLNQIARLSPLSVPCSAFRSSLGEQVLDNSKWAAVLQQLTQCTAAPRGSQDTGALPPSLPLLSAAGSGCRVSAPNVSLLQIHSY